MDILSDVLSGSHKTVQLECGAPINYIYTVQQLSVLIDFFCRRHQLMYVLVTDTSPFRPCLPLSPIDIAWQVEIIPRLRFGLRPFALICVAFARTHTCTGLTTKTNLPPRIQNPISQAQTI
jgi:hypothetical protein